MPQSGLRDVRVTTCQKLVNDLLTTFGGKACALNDLRFSAEARETVVWTGANRPTVKHKAHNGFVSDVVQSDDGRYRLGLHDGGLGFETRTFAASVLAHKRPPPGPEMRSPAAANDGANRKIKEQPQQNTTSAIRLQEISISWRSA